MSKQKIRSDFDWLEYGKTEKIVAGIIPEYGVSTSAWKSPLQLREWFCPVDLNLEKMKLMMQTHLPGIIHDTAMCLHFHLDRLLYTLI